MPNWNGLRDGRLKQASAPTPITGPLKLGPVIPLDDLYPYSDAAPGREVPRGCFNENVLIVDGRVIVVGGGKVPVKWPTGELRVPLVEYDAATGSLIRSTLSNHKNGGGCLTGAGSMSNTDTQRIVLNYADGVVFTSAGGDHGKAAGTWLGTGGLVTTSFQLVKTPNGSGVPFVASADNCGRGYGGGHVVYPNGMWGHCFATGNQRWTHEPGGTYNINDTQQWWGCEITEKVRDVTQNSGYRDIWRLRTNDFAIDGGGYGMATGSPFAGCMDDAERFIGFGHKTYLTPGAVSPNYTHDYAGGMKLYRVKQTGTTSKGECDLIIETGYNPCPVGADVTTFYRHFHAHISYRDGIAFAFVPQQTISGVGTIRAYIAAFDVEAEVKLYSYQWPAGAFPQSCYAAPGWHTGRAIQHVQAGHTPYIVNAAANGGMLAVTVQWTDGLRLPVSATFTTTVPSATPVLADLAIVDGMLAALCDTDDNSQAVVFITGDVIPPTGSTLAECKALCNVAPLFDGEVARVSGLVLPGTPAATVTQAVKECFVEEAGRR